MYMHGEHWIGQFHLSDKINPVGEIGFILTKNGKVNALGGAAASSLGIGCGDSWQGLEGDFSRETMRLVTYKYEIPGNQQIHLLAMDQSEKVQEFESILNEYWAVLSEGTDEIFVTDAKGKVLRLSSRNPDFLGYQPEELIGENVHELEKKGVLSPSITVQALARNSDVMAVQETGTGRKLLVRSFLVRNDEGAVSRVISLSKDISELSDLRKRIDDMNNQIAQYRDMLSHYTKIQQGGRLLIGESESVHWLREMIHKAAAVDSTILLQGESGTGKDVVARNIHILSSRQGKPFYRINCGAIPENLLESELFGYAKGAFTGAMPSGKQGLVEAAEQGTLFLDEIGDMPLSLQIKLLELVQDKLYKRVGDSTYHEANIRIIAATHQNLAQLAQENRFRRDLYYRLNVFPIHIAPLREREGDIRLLLHHFTMFVNAKTGKDVVFSEEAIREFEAYSWPGNVRELENVTERLIILADGKTVGAQDVQNVLRNALDPLPDMEGPYTLPDAYSAVQVNAILPWKDAVDMLSRKLFAMGMRRYKTITETARHLGVHYSTVSRYLSKSKNDNEEF